MIDLSRYEPTGALHVVQQLRQIGSKYRGAHPYQEVSLARERPLPVDSSPQIALLELSPRKALTIALGRLHTSLSLLSVLKEPLENATLRQDGPGQTLADGVF